MNSIIPTITIICAFFFNSFNGFTQKSQPNIIMIAVDDLNDWIGPYGGHPQVKTPNIDQLAEKSVLFKNSSCPGPVCGPSRSALLSGFMPASTGAYYNNNNMLDSKLVQENATLPEYFSKHGYVTISSGKIFHKHSTENGMDHGHWAFDEWTDLPDDSKIDEEKFFSRNKGIINGKSLDEAKYTEKWGAPFEFGPTLGGMEKTKDYKTAMWFAEKLKEDYDKPFFMSVGIFRPHLPWIVPQQFFDMYNRDSIILPEFKMDDLDDIVNKDGTKKFKPHPDFLWCQEYEVHKDAVRAYMASISYADECVGVVLDALANSQYAENTIIVLWGDHGWHLGEKLKFRKATLWRESTQLPLMVSLPGMDTKTECNRNVNLIDLYPTLIELTGLPSKQLDGQSLTPLLKNPELDWKPTVTTLGKGNHSVMSEAWHYIIYANGAEELYDLRTDPMEWNNLANQNSGELDSVKSFMRGFLPENEADPLPARKKEWLDKLDATIKSNRNLNELK
jgi:arylsulfatase A-like enzyme